MSTVAFRDGVLAADTLVCDGDLKSSGTKLILLTSAIVGFAGVMGFGRLFAEWVGKGKRKSSKPEWGGGEQDQFEALVLNRKGCTYWDSTLCPIPVEDEFTAIGTGAAVAIGAMHMGATAVEAVEAAIKFDRNTGGKVVSFSVKDFKRKR